MGEQTSSLKGQFCPACHKKTLTLTEGATDVPFFGKVFLFSMGCDNCDFKKADIEAEEKKEPIKYEIEVSSEKDMNTRIVKSSYATVKIPHIMTMNPGEASEGYITNIEGLLKRVLDVIKATYETEEDQTKKKKAKNLMKKLQKVMQGREKLKIIIEDKSGNSAIISEKAKKTRI